MGQLERMHANRWTLQGYWRLAWRGVGKTDAHRGGLADSWHSLGAMTSASHNAAVAQEKAFAKKLQDMTTCGRGLFISRFHDATPQMLRFGLLQEEVYQHVRYLIRGSSRPSA